MRQHVNPLSSFFQLPIALPTPEEIFLDKKLPIHLDIGCARGQFLIKLASKEKKWNFIGLDIRKALIDAAEKERNQLQLDNLKFLFCNANVSLDSLLQNLGKANLQRVSIQFPDPWFKRRHKKRRVFNSSFLLILASHLKPGSELFIQSDVFEVFKSMFDLINKSGYFNNESKERLIENPFGIATEREQFSLQKRIVVYRSLFIRNGYYLNGPQP